MVYFVDANIIISYIEYSNNNIINALIKFINDSTIQFYYTETVKKEVNVGYHIIPDVFKYWDSSLTEYRKNRAYLGLMEYLKSININETQKNDIYMIFEASYSCYDVTGNDDFSESYLFTHNLTVYKSWQKELETIINDSGFEHLIEIVGLDFLKK